MSRPDDAEILGVLRARPNGVMTYVAHNILRETHRTLTTRQVRDRLEKLQRQGRVRTVRSNYAVQLCWALAPPVCEPVSGARVDGVLVDEIGLPASSSLSHGAS